MVWVLKFGADGYKIRQFCVEPSFHLSTIIPMISEFLGHTNPAGRHSLTILLLFVFNLLLFWISGSGITFWSYSRDADLVWNCHCNCSITSKKWFTFWTPWKSSRFACSAMTTANISWVNFRFRFRKNIPTAVWGNFLFILFFLIQLQALRISCKNTVWLRPTSMFLGNGSNKLFNIANVSWKRKLLKATNLVILRLLSIEFQVIVYILSKTCPNLSKLFWKRKLLKATNLVILRL